MKIRFYHWLNEKDKKMIAIIAMIFALVIVGRVLFWVNISGKPTFIFAKEVSISDTTKKTVRNLSRMKFVRKIDTDFSIEKIVELTDISFLNEMKYVENLKLFSTGENRTLDLSPLETCTSLKSFGGIGFEVHDLHSFRNCTNLESLAIGYGYYAFLEAQTETKITDISALKGLKNLESIKICYSDVSDLSALNELKSLYDISFDDSTCLTRINISDELPNIEHISFSNCKKLTDISGVSFFPNLSSADFSGSAVKDLSPLYELKNLESVYLSDYQLTEEAKQRFDEMGVEVVVEN